MASDPSQTAVLDEAGAATNDGLGATSPIRRCKAPMAAIGETFENMGFDPKPPVR
jgi:hypothetical protein